MGADLKARNPAIGWYSTGGFSWSWMLDSGVGLPIGCGRGPCGQFIYTPRTGIGGGPSCPYYNDGFPVTADEARAMARAAWGLVAIERHTREAWEALDAAERARIEALPYRDWERERRVPVRVDFVDKAEAFAWWAWASGGFRIC